MIRRALAALIAVAGLGALVLFGGTLVHAADEAKSAPSDVVQVFRSVCQTMPMDRDTVRQWADGAKDSAHACKMMAEQLGKATEEQEASDHHPGTLPSGSLDSTLTRMCDQMMAGQAGASTFCPTFVAEKIRQAEVLGHSANPLLALWVPVVSCVQLAGKLTGKPQSEGVCLVGDKAPPFAAFQPYSDNLDSVLAAQITRHFSIGSSVPDMIKAAKTVGFSCVEANKSGPGRCSLLTQVFPFSPKQGPSMAVTWNWVMTWQVDNGKVQSLHVEMQPSSI